MVNYRYKVVPDAPHGGYRVFDTVTQKFVLDTTPWGGTVTPMATGDFSLWKKQEEAEAWVDQMPSEGVGKKDGKFPQHPPLQLREEEKSEHQQKMDRWQTIVLRKLEGKVCCSRCGKGFYGNDDSRHGDGKTMLKVTRYLGAENPASQLMVDLECTWCGHGGMYQFEDNPVAPLDIPF